jgi:hypothetical protein
VAATRSWAGTVVPSLFARKPMQRCFSSSPGYGISARLVRKMVPQRRVVLVDAQRAKLVNPG